ncbi:MAG: cytochrome C oxidase subunit IV family protein [Verrucomicrobiae bacterium]|nr:cytochrome C oxidase subunit IV family protein [Verrucomicrobiae bacterium]
MAGDDAVAIKNHLKFYVGIFAALLVLTVITVVVSYIHLGTAGNITLALVIATLKASLVAAFFMHLSSEKTTIYRLMISALFFFLVLVFLSIFAFLDPIRN